MRRTAFSIGIGIALAACVSLDGLSGGAGDAGPPIGNDAGPDKDPTGACAKAGLTCTAHSRCDESSGTAACACVTGYVREGDACAWRGGPANPGFTTLDAWKLAQGATIDAAKAAAVEPGVLTLATMGASATQSFPMPPYVDAEPFALVVTASASEGGKLRPLVGRGLAFLPDFANSFSEQRTCLGERAYGGTIELSLGLSRPDSTSLRPSMNVDHVSIVPAPECPPIGTIPNGDFEVTGNWEIRASSGTAEIATGVGTKGGRAGRLATTNKCQSPAIYGNVSSPSSLPRAAISFSYKGTPDQYMFVGLGDNALAFVRGTGVFEAAHLCLPQHAKGAVEPLGFFIADGGGTCADPLVREFIFDDLAYVTDPNCPELADIVDGGFEQVAANSKFSSWIAINTGGFETKADFVGEPRTGQAALRLGTSKKCEEPQVTQTITVPFPAESQGSGGPAVHFWYRADTTANVEFRAEADGASITLPASAAYANKTLCLDPKSIGRPAVLSFKADGGSGTCADSFPAANMFVDDVEVGHDPTCPSD